MKPQTGTSTRRTTDDNEASRHSSTVTVLSRVLLPPGLRRIMACKHAPNRIDPPFRTPQPVPAPGGLSQARSFPFGAHPVGAPPGSAIRLRDRRGGIGQKESDRLLMRPMGATRGELCQAPEGALARCARQGRGDGWAASVPERQSGMRVPALTP
jgi:hypothetical protein